MKKIIIFFLFFSTWARGIDISGSILADKKCQQDQFMVWLSTTGPDAKEILLSHIQVPLNGSFKFYVRPGNYLVRATSSSSCIAEHIVAAEKDKNVDLKLVLKDKEN